MGSVVNSLASSWTALQHTKSSGCPVRPQRTTPRLKPSFIRKYSQQMGVTCPPCREIPQEFWEIMWVSSPLQLSSRNFQCTLFYVNHYRGLNFKRNIFRKQRGLKVLASKPSWWMLSPRRLRRYKLGIIKTYSTNNIENMDNQMENRLEYFWTFFWSNIGLPENLLHISDIRQSTNVLQ